MAVSNLTRCLLIMNSSALPRRADRAGRSGEADQAGQITFAATLAWMAFCVTGTTGGLVGAT